jgi:hypothetical protein
MDYHSFGKEDGTVNLNDETLFRKMFEDPRKPPKHIDLNQVPDDTNDMPDTWRTWLGTLALGIILSIMCLSAVFYKLMIA